MDKNLDNSSNVKDEALKKVRQKVAIVDVEDLLKKEARDAADAKMNMAPPKNPEELKGFKKYFKKEFWGRTREQIWKHTFFEKYYRDKELTKITSEIRNTGNIYATQENIDKDAHNKTMQAIAERFMLDYEGAVDDKEERKTLEADKPEVITAKADIKNLIFDYIKGSVSKEVFVSSKNRIISTLNGEKDNRESKMYADNLLELADNAKIAVEHGVKMEELDMDFDIIVGKAKSGIKTEAKLGAIEKAVSTIKGTQVGRFINPATLTTAVGIAYSAMSATGKIAKMFGMSKIAAYTTFGVTAGVSGVLAAANESERLANERRELTRKLAKGGIISGNSEQNEEMRKYVYEMKSSNDLSASLREAVFIKDKNGNDVLKDIKEEDLPKVLEILSEIETRKSLANEREIDLISYSNPGNVEKEKLDLIKLVATAKYGVKSKLENELKGKLPGGQDFDAYFDNQVQTMKDSLLGGEKGITSTDKAFKWAKIKGSAAVGAKTVAYGIAFGALFQELFALGSWAMGGHKVGLIQGIVEQMKDGEVSHESVETPLETLRGWITGHPLHMEMNGAIDMNVEGHDFKAPQGTNILKNPDGTFNILHGDRVVSENVPFEYNSDGTLKDVTIDRLGEDGVLANSTGSMIESTKEIVTSANDWIHNHLDKTTHIMREWMGNDTPNYPDPHNPGHLLGSDLNELRTQWVGNGIDEHGDYVMTVQHMTDDGSFQNGVSVAAQEEMKKGNLEVLFSVTKDSQVNVLKGVIGTDGLIHIPHDSLEGKMLFNNTGNHAKYVGAFLEIAKHNGNMADGREIMQILGTHIGENNPHDITEVITTTEPFSTTEINLPIAKEGPWVIPVPKHKPLEPITYKNFNERGPAYYGYGETGSYGLLDRKYYRERLSSKLKENSEYDLSGNDLDIVKEYLDKQDKAYMKELEIMTSSIPKMSDDIETVITIPSRQEGKNIEKTIRNYAKLKNRNKFEIVILDNHPADKTKDNTEEVLSRMKKEFPDLNIVYLYKVFDKKPVIGDVRKYLVDAVMLQKQKSGVEKSIAIVSNDMDLEDISENYTNDIADAFKKDKKLDAIGGKWDYPEKDFEKLPIMHASQRLWHYFDIVFRYNYLKSPDLIGRNSAFRSGTYAAIGGYNKDAKLAEDLEIGWFIKDARKYDMSRISYLNKASLVSNSRRAVAKMLSGGRLIEQYGDFHENEEVRGKSVDELLKDKKDFDLETFKKEVQSIYNYYTKFKKSKNGWVEDRFVDQTFDRAMKFTGVEFKKISDTIEIVNIDKLLKGLSKGKKI